MDFLLNLLHKTSFCFLMLKNDVISLQINMLLYEVFPFLILIILLKIINIINWQNFTVLDTVYNIN